MFIHWGLYSRAAGQWNGTPSRGGEHFMLSERISLKDYVKIANDFDPVSINAEKCVKPAKQAGLSLLLKLTVEIFFVKREKLYRFIQKKRITDITGSLSKKEGIPLGTPSLINKLFLSYKPVTVI
ncbi:hypothetical protein GGR21_002265 [Dysgonomonas hofstadii]|uniref:Uncharacterized protein n=1 Tax=Dysgonomonas hofstadii TaxID=637886 RepID=A0A840CWX6_9BACT|nr:hypothetical protein [Dysgonomonas hofstadii]